MTEYNLTGRKAYLGRMGTDNDNDHSVPNAWMTSTPAHPFWLLPLESIVRNIDSGMEAERVTGPVALRDAVIQYEEEYRNVDIKRLDRHYRKSGWRNLYVPDRRTPQSVTVLPSWEIYPYSWERDGQAFRDVCSTFDGGNFNAKKCKELVGTDHWGTNGSYTITYWSHSWDYGENALHDWEHMEALMEGNAEATASAEAAAETGLEEGDHDG